FDLHCRERGGRIRYWRNRRDCLAAAGFRYLSCESPLHLGWVSVAGRECPGDKPGRHLRLNQPDVLGTHLHQSPGIWHNHFFRLRRHESSQEILPRRAVAVAANRTVLSGCSLVHAVGHVLSVLSDEPAEQLAPDSESNGP